MGGSSLVSIFSGIVKTKVIALLLGPQGVGILAMLQSIQSTASLLAGMGLTSSGVREVAAAASQNNSQLLVGLKKVLWGAALGFGLLFAGLIIWLRGDIAHYVINDRAYRWAVGWSS
jgi:PST family polysaccharide transporter